MLTMRCTVCHHVAPHSAARQPHKWVPDDWKRAIKGGIRNGVGNDSADGNCRQA